MSLPTSGLVGHYEARLENGYSNNDGLTVATDNSGQGNHLEDVNGSPTFVTNAINGHPAYQPNGVSDRIFYAANIGISASALTMTLVVQSDGSSGRKWPFVLNGSAIASSTDRIFAITENVDNNGWGSFIRTNNGDWQAQDTADTTNWTVLTLTWDGSTGRLYVDGDETLSGSRSGSAMGIHTISLLGFNGGGSLNNESIFGRVAFAAAWTQALDAADRAQVHTYIQNTYGLQVADYVPDWIDATEFDEIATNSYEDDTVAPGEWYRYAVKGVNAAGESEFSDWVLIQTSQDESGPAAPVTIEVAESATGQKGFSSDATSHTIEVHEQASSQRAHQAQLYEALEASESADGSAARQGQAQDAISALTSTQGASSRSGEVDETVTVSASVEGGVSHAGETATAVETHEQASGSAARAGQAEEAVEVATEASQTTARAGTSSISGAGTLSAVGALAVADAVGITGAGVLAADWSTAREDAPAISSAGNINIDTQANRFGEASVSSGGSFYVEAAKYRFGDEAISGGGSIEPGDQSRTTTGQGSLSGTGSLQSFDELKNTLAELELSGGKGVWFGQGTRGTDGAPIVSGNGSLYVEWQGAWTGEAFLSGGGSWFGVGDNLSPVVIALGLTHRLALDFITHTEGTIDFTHRVQAVDPRTFRNEHTAEPASRHERTAEPANRTIYQPSPTHRTQRDVQPVRR